MLIVSIFLALSFIFTFPFGKELKIKDLNIKIFKLPVYSLLVAIYSFFSLEVEIVTAKIIGLCFITVVLCTRNEQSIKHYIYNCLLLFTTSLLVMNLEDSTLLTMGLFSIATIAYNRESGLRALLSLVFLILPLVNGFSDVFYAWSPIILVAVFLYIHLLKDLDRLLPLLYILFLSGWNDSHFMMNYSPLITLLFGAILIIINNKSEHIKLFLAIGLFLLLKTSEPLFLVASYLSVELFLQARIELMKLIDQLEVQDGSIKNISYVQIFVGIATVYMISGAPGSPLSWLFASRNWTIDLTLFLILLDMTRVTKLAVLEARQSSRDSLMKKQEKYLSYGLSLVALIFLCGKELLYFDPWTLIFLLISVLVAFVFKGFRPLLMNYLNIFEGITIDSLSVYRGNKEQFNEKINNKPYLRYRILKVDGLDESLIWSIFIFIVSVLLIGRYL